MLVSSSLKKLIVLLADGQFHSGTQLAKNLNMSRSGICKQLKGLSQIGLDIHAVSGKGYRLDQPLQLLSKDDITHAISKQAQTLINQLEVHDCIDSTNQYLLTKSAHNASGLICLAEYQMSGKGRRGKQWVSPFGSNIYLSIRWHYQQGLSAINGLSLAVGVAVIDALKEQGIEDIGLKWPNDIYCQHKKLAGILIDVAGEANGSCYAVIGLGLNLYLPANQTETITQPWIDLKQLHLTTSNTMRNLLITSLLNHLMPTIANFEQDTLKKYLDKWRSYDCMQGREVNLYTPQHTMLTGTIEGIDDNGLLLLRDKKGKITAFASADVSLQQL